MNAQTINHPKEAAKVEGIKNRTKQIKVEGQDNKNLDKGHELINSEANKLAVLLGINGEALQEWLSDYAKVPTRAILALLHIAGEYHLNPLNNELALTAYDDGQWQAIVTVDGLYKLINREPAFCGMTFTESSERKNDIPVWMECAIFRSDRINPIVIKEYFDEVKSSFDSWEKMPRRMLRHRTLQQCARAAFGFTGLSTYLEINSELKPIIPTSETSQKLQPKMNLTRTEELKSSLLSVDNSSPESSTHISRTQFSKT
jgi:RecT family